ncbi:MAG: hypothetical protein SGILL_008175 [Bacillariaceae sp.]
MNVYDKAWAGNFLRDILQGTLQSQDPGSIWRPRVRPGEFIIFYVVSPDNNDDEPDFFTTVVEGEADCSEGALAEPISFKCQWGAGDADSFAFWRPVCPEGYVSMSDITVNGQSCNEGESATENPDGAFRCVHASIVEEVDLGKTVWQSKILSEEAEIQMVGNSNQGFRIFQRDSSQPGAFVPADTIQYRLSNVPAPLYKDLIEVLTLSNPSNVDQRMSFTLQKGIQSTRTEEIKVSSEFRTDFSKKVSAGVKGVGEAEATLSFGFTLLTSSTITRSDLVSTTQTTNINIVVPALSSAKLAQMVVVDSQLGSAAAATTLFTSNFGLDIQPIDPTSASPVFSANVTNGNGSTVASGSCSSIAVDTARVLERQEATDRMLAMIFDAITTTGDAVFVETDKILQATQVGTNERLAVTSEKVESNGNLLLNVQNNIESEKAMLQIILDVLSNRNGGKRNPKMSGDGGNNHNRGNGISNDY